MSLVVTCPSCGTVFTMVREQLEASSGHVRCGHCMQVFDAKAQLVQVKHETSLEQAVSTEFKDSIHNLQQAAPHTSLSFVRQAQKMHFWSRPAMRNTLMLASALLAGLLLLQMVRNELTRLTHWIPSVAAMAQKICSADACTKPAHRQIGGWLIEHSSFEKERNSSFKLTVNLKNISSSTLLVPHVEISLLDSADAVLVRRVLISDANDTSTASGGAERPYSWLIALQPNAGIKLNAKDIAGYRLMLFYP